MDPEENNNLYHPESAGKKSDATPNASSKNLTFSWTASEYIEHQRGPGWYLALAASFAVIAAVIYLVTREYIAVATIIIAGIIVAVFVGRKPQVVTYELSDSGLSVGPKKYSYGQFKSFTVIKEGALSSITLIPIKRFSLPVSAFFEAKDEEKITNILGERLPYEERKQDTVDKLSRRLRI